MADFNSRYTGAEIEEAIGKTDSVTQIKRIYFGAPVKGILLQSLPAKPDDSTNWAGLYYVVYSELSTPLTEPGTKSGTSMLFIGNEDGGAAGTASVGMGTDDMYSVKSKYNLGSAGTDKKIHAYGYIHAFSSGTATETELYIHAVYRKERVVDTTSMVSEGSTVTEVL